MKLVTFLLVGCSSVALAQLPPHPVPEVTRNGDTCNLDWTGQNSITYFVQYSLDLQSWSYMPVIESGDGSAIGYGFQCNADNMFVRLHYTDIPTSSPSSFDFDGDGISSWDEIRVGGTGTSPLIADTDGNGQIDYFNDGDNNGLADAWELEHFGSIGTADPSVDSDDDGLSNYEESLMGSDPNDQDTDSDGKLDSQEAVWWDQYIEEWPRSKEVQYAVIELDGLGLNVSANYVESLDLSQAGSIHSSVPKNEWTIQALSNAGHVLIVEDKRSQSGAQAALNPSAIPDSIKNHVWNPSTASWVVLKNDKAGGANQDALAVATAVSADGKASGFAWIPLADANGDPVGGPGVERVVAKWADLGANTIPLMETALNGNAHTTFSTDNDALELGFYPESLSISDDGGVLYTQSSASGIALKLEGVTVANDTTFLSTFPSTQMTGQGDVFYKDPTTGDYRVRLFNGNTVAVVQGTEKPDFITAVGRIAKHNDHAANINMAALANGMWARRNNAWRKIQPHPKRGFTGGLGVSDDFTVLLSDGKTIMRNGKHLSIDGLVPSADWSDFRMEKMNDRGVMAGRAKKSGQDKIVLLVPVEIFQPELNANGEIVQENGVDKLVSVDAIRPSRWMNAWVWNDQIFIYEFDENFIANDPDRFYISTPMEWQAFDPKWMQLMGLSETVPTKLNFEEITNGGKKTFQSKSLILVLDEPDDVISFNPDFGVDDADDDLTHRVMQDDLPLDSEIGLLVPASIGGVSSAQWTQLKIKQPTHELEVDVVLLVSPLNASNTSHHNFYKARLDPYLEWARASYGRIGIEFKSNFSVQAVSQAMWDDKFVDNDLTSAESKIVAAAYGQITPSRPIIFIVSTKLNSGLDHGFAFGFPGRDEYGHAFISLNGSASDQNEYVLAHEVGHILGYVPKSWVDPAFRNLRAYPPSFHVADEMKHNLMIRGGESKHSNNYDDSKRIDLSQQKLFLTSEFIKEK